MTDQKHKDQSRSGQPQPGSGGPDQRGDLKARIVAAGTGWCAFSHHHDNSRAALAAAREAILIAFDRIVYKTTQRNG